MMPHFLKTKNLETPFLKKEGPQTPPKNFCQNIAVGRFINAGLLASITAC